MPRPVPCSILESIMTIYHPLLSQERPGVLHYGGARITLLDVEASFWGLCRHLEALVGGRLSAAVLQQAGVNGGASFARTFIGKGVGDAQALRDCIAAFQAAGFGRFEIVELEWSSGPDKQLRPDRILIRGTDTFEAWMVRQHGQLAEAPVCAYTSGVLVGFVNVLGDRRDVVCLKRTCQGMGDDACLFELLPADQAADTPVIAFDPDPFLSQQLNLLEILFDRMPMGIAILDKDLVLRRFNPTWAFFIDRYTSATRQQVGPGVPFFGLVPEVLPVMGPIFERVLSGKTVRQESMRLECKGVVSFWDVVLTPLVESEEVVGLVEVMTDATERVLAYQNLEQRVEERTSEIERRRRVAESLRDVLGILNSNRSLDEILDYIVDQACQLLDAEAVAIYRLLGDDNILRIQTARGLDPGYAAEANIPLGQSVSGQAALKRQPMMLSDVAAISSDDDLPLDRQRQALLERLGTQYRALLAIPLGDGDKYGAITLYYREPRLFSDEDVALAVAFSDQVALAIENARLRVRAEQSAVAAERSRIARDLHDSVTQVLFSASLIAEVLPAVWERDIEEGQQALAEMRQLTRGALAEMRTLLLELRPAALTEAKLGDLLHQLAEVVTGRARVPVKVKVNDVGTLPPDVHIALYRIAQEALNNVIKHAEASQAIVRLHCRPTVSDLGSKGTREESVRQVELYISDNGQGFDASQTPLDRLGLGIMRERAEAIGATLTVESQPGRGAQIKVAWQDTKEERE